MSNHLVTSKFSKRQCHQNSVDTLHTSDLHKQMFKIYIHEFVQIHCGGLNRYDPHRFMCFNAGSIGVVLLECMALVETCPCW